MMWARVAMLAAVLVVAWSVRHEWRALWDDDDTDRSRWT